MMKKSKNPGNIDSHHPQDDLEASSRQNASDDSIETVLEAAARASQVNCAKPSVWGNSAFLIAASVILFIILVMVFGHHSDQKAQEASNQMMVTQNSSDELAENLERLQQSQALPSSASFNQADDQAAFSKEMLSRQNAPMEIYSASESSLNPANTQAANEASVLAGHNAYAQFANQSMDASTVTATQILHPEYTIASGEFIHATLETAISSDLPGQVRAITETPVYAYLGQAPIIPAGSRLIGQYSSSVMQGQNRIFVIWNRIILPNGISVMINSPGTDELGRAGNGADDVDTHFFARFGQAILLSLIGAGAANVGVSASNTQNNSAADYRSAMAQSFQQSAEDSLQTASSMPPTLTIYQGAKINVFVSHDLDFYGVLHESA